METHITIMGVSPARHNKPRAQAHPARREAQPLGRMGRSPHTGNPTRRSHTMGAHDSKTPLSNLNAGESANLTGGQALDSLGCCHRAIVPANRIRLSRYAFPDAEMVQVGVRCQSVLPA